MSWRGVQAGPIVNEGHVAFIRATEFCVEVETNQPVDTNQRADSSLLRSIF